MKNGEKSSRQREQHEQSTEVGKNERGCRTDRVGQRVVEGMRTIDRNAVKAEGLLVCIAIAHTLNITRML